MKKMLYTLICLLPMLAVAQDFKLGKVTKAELGQQTHHVDTSAPAAILYKTGTTYFDFNGRGNWEIVTDVSVRIKIYKKEGYGYGTVEVPLYHQGADREQVTFHDAITYNLEGGQIVKSKLEDSGEFIEETEKNWKTSKITLPNIKEGSVIEYRYVIKSPYFSSLPIWYFQYPIPVNYVEYGVHIPHFFTYNRILSPYVPITEKMESKKQTRSYSNPNPKGAYNASNASVQTETGSVVFYETRKTYTAKDIPALNDEQYVDNIRNYQSFVKHELASTQFPNAPKKEYATTWDAVAKFIYNEEGFGDELNRKGYFEKDIDALLATSGKRDEVVESIFDFVKNRMAWNGKYGYTITNKLHSAYQEKSGSVAEINLMLISMLRYAGFNANPILLSTRNKGHVSFVNRNEFNYVIVGVESQNGVKFLDATSKNASPGILPLRALNGTGRLIRENQSSIEVSLMPTTNSLENTSVAATVSADGTVRGKVKSYYFDYNAFRYRENYLGMSKESYIEKLEKKLGSARISDYQVTNDDDFTKPVLEDFSFESDNIVESIGGKLYISPMLMYTISHNPFKQEKRLYPIDFIFPHQDKYTFSITLPEGYSIESLPESAYYPVRDNVGGFRFNISAVGQNQVQVVVVNNINHAMLNADYYPALKEFYNSIVTKEGEKIVLKKL